MSRLRDGLRTQLWPLPAIGVILGVGLGIGLPRLDAHIDHGLSASTSAYLFGGGPSAARTLLGTIASSLITVTALTFSLTVVTLQLASSQFSPRLLRTFTRDRFVLFLAHLARQIRVETMLRNVHAEASETVRRVLGGRAGDLPPEAALAPPVDAAPLLAGASGFLVQIDESALLAAAVDSDAVLRVGCWPGSSLVAGTPVGVAWLRHGSSDPDALTRLGERFVGALSTGFERAAVHDIGYGLRQLTDVANKALSPGINDPTTAVYALGHCSALLCELAGKDLGPRCLEDDDGRVRVVLQRPGFADLLELAVAQPRRYGAADPLVLGRLFALLGEVAWCTRDAEQRQASLTSWSGCAPRRRLRISMPRSASGWRGSPRG